MSWYNSSSSSRNKERYDTLATIDEFLNKVSHVKKAACRKGETTHPSKDVPDNTHRVQLGERFEEHKEDVEEHLGDEANTTSNTEIADAKVAAVRRILREYKKLADTLVRDAKEVATDGGMKVTPTGEDPEHETESTKDTKDDPGTEHPANTENEDLNGGKYASYRDLPVEKLASLYKELADKICYRIAHGIAEEVKTAYDAAHNLAYQTVSKANPVLDNLLLNDYLKNSNNDEKAILEELQKRAAAEEALLNYLSLLNQQQQKQQKLKKEAQPMPAGGGGGEEAAAAITPDMLASVPPEVMMSDTSVPVSDIPSEPPVSLPELSDVTDTAGGEEDTVGEQELEELLQDVSPEELVEAISELPPEMQEAIAQELDKELEDAGVKEVADVVEKQSFDAVSPHLFDLLSAEKQAEDEAVNAKQLEEILDNVTPEKIASIVEQLNPEDQEVLLQELVSELNPGIVRDAIKEVTASSHTDDEGESSSTVPASSHLPNTNKNVASRTVNKGTPVASSSPPSQQEEEKQSSDINVELLNLLSREIAKQSVDAALNELNLKKN